MENVFKYLQISRAEVVTFCIKVTTAAILTYFSTKYMVKFLDPNYNTNKAAQKKVEKLRKRLNIDESIDFSEHEMRIATMLVPCVDGLEWSQIGGCDDLLAELHDRVILPLKLRAEKALPESDLFRPSKGILLHGPPGCGKTLIARAIARSANANFIYFDSSILFDKWYGESQKLTAALFSLAEKVQPCIIFIDEIDSFLRTRNSSDHESTALMKSQFLSLWDGFYNNNASIIVLGATNRPHDVDKAILRRMPMRFLVSLPNEKARAEILRILLENEYISKNINYAAVAQVTQKMSGSDLKEVCRLAALSRLKSANSDWQLTNDKPDMSLLEIEEEDLLNSAKSYKKDTRISPTVGEIDVNLYLD